MTMTFTPGLLQQARRNAQRLARAKNLKLHEAQDHIAQTYGSKNWSLFAKRCSAEQVPLPPRGNVQKLNRFLAHGDQSDGDPATYYCSMCDVFDNAQHFDTEHRQDHAERLHEQLKRYANLPREVADRNYRDPETVNLFSQALTIFLAQLQARERSRSPFYRWLELQRDRDDAVGDLAADITKDRMFPVDASLLETREYLESKWLSGAALNALKAAWAEFSAQATHS